MTRKKTMIPFLDGVEHKDSLRERVYDYLNENMANGSLRYGEYLDQNKICRKLEISKAPLRDALIRLEAEGFVSILPSRGVVVKPLTIDVVKGVYQIIGALEADCIDVVFSRFTEEHVRLFQESNERQREYLESGDHKAYYNENIRFHNIFLDLSDNPLLQALLTPLRRRLYDFPRRVYSREWEEVHLEEHTRFIDSVRKGNRRSAVSVFRDEHWSFAVHRKYLHTYYAFDE